MKVSNSSAAASEGYLDAIQEGDRYKHLHIYTDAIRQYKQALQKIGKQEGKERDSILFSLFTCYSHLGNSTEAKKQYQAMSDRSQQQWMSYYHYYIGISFLKTDQAQYDKAYDFLAQAENLLDKDYGYLSLIGRLCLRLHKYDEAAKYLTKAFTDNPHDIAVLQSLPSALGQQLKLSRDTRRVRKIEEKLLECVTAATSLHKESSAVWYNIGLAYMYLFELIQLPQYLLDNAIPALDKARSINLLDPDVLYQLGVCHVLTAKNLINPSYSLYKKHIDKAVNYISEALVYSPKDKDLEQMLAYCRKQTISIEKQSVPKSTLKHIFISEIIPAALILPHTLFEEEAYTRLVKNFAQERKEVIFPNHSQDHGKIIVKEILQQAAQDQHCVYIVSDSFLDTCFSAIKEELIEAAEALMQKPGQKPEQEIRILTLASSETPKSETNLDRYIAEINETIRKKNTRKTTGICHKRLPDAMPYRREFIVAGSMWRYQYDFTQEYAYASFNNTHYAEQLRKEFNSLWEIV